MYLTAMTWILYFNYDVSYYYSIYYSSHCWVIFTSNQLTVDAHAI